MNLSFTANPAWAELLGNIECYSGLLHVDAQIGDIAATSCVGLSYVATPYSNLVTGDFGFLPDLSQACARVAAGWSAALMLHGIMAISPIVQSAAMVQAAPGRIDPLDSVLWANWCSTLLVQCRRVIVPPIPGWDESIGIFAEVKSALDRNCQVFLLADDSPVADLSVAA